MFYGILVEIDLYRSDSMLSTARTYSTSLNSVIFALLGSIFGLSESIRVFKEFTEGRSTTLESLYNRKTKIKKIQESNKKLSREFDYLFNVKEKIPPKRNKSAKIMPSVTSDGYIPT